MRDAQHNVLRESAGTLSNAVVNGLRTMRGRWAVALAITAVFLLVSVPLTQLIQQSLRLGGPGRMGDWTLSHYRQATAGGGRLVEAFTNTMIVSVVGTAITLALATLFAWLIERTDMPLRNLAFILLLIPMAMPGILFVMAWSMLLGPTNGFLNIMIRDALGAVGITLERGPFDIYTLTGIIFLDGMRGVSTLFLMLIGAFRLFNPSSEEAARVSGAGGAATLRRVTLPALLPALMVAGMYSLVSSMEQFESALVVGLPGNIFLLSTLIFFNVQMRNPINYGLGAVYSIMFIMIMLVMVVIYRRIVRNSEMYATVTGKGYRPRRIELGRWRWPAFGLVGVFTTLGMIMPALFLGWVSLQPPRSGIRIGQSTSLQNYRTIIASSSEQGIAWNTIHMAVVTATVTMVIAFLVSWAIVRGPKRFRGLLDGLSFIPYAFPGITVAVALLIAFLTPPLNRIPIYGTVYILAVGLTTQYLAFSTRLMNGSIVQVSKELEEAAHVGGAPNTDVLRRITLPLILPAFVAGWIWVAVHALRAFSIPLVLATGGNQVVASRLYAMWNGGNPQGASALGTMLMLALIPMTFLMRRLILSLGHSD